MIGDGVRNKERYQCVNWNCEKTMLKFAKIIVVL